ncbi:hypothetical protein WMF04_00820 [Sorangium sp. So ce260]|uniref:hypothetical protein n=1 Tax=Sorangium sp. So ce260 TaxID=3133291 RepID=UPI003F5D92FC
MRTGVLGAIVLINAGLGCQPAPSAPDAGVEQPSAPDAGVEQPPPDPVGNPNPLCPGPVAPGTGEVATLSLPARTRSTMTGYHIASTERSTRTRVIAEGEATIALGPDYPGTLTITLDAVVDPRCCCEPLEGTISIDDIGAIQGAATVEQTGPTTFAVSVSEEGTSTFDVSGVLAVPAGGLDGCSEYDDTRELPVTLSMTVRAARPRWQIEAPAECGERTVIQSSRPLPITTVALDAMGQRFWPQNVEHAAVTVAGDGVGLRAPEGGAPSDIVATGDGTVVITATDGGASREVSVIPAARIDAMDVVFAIGGYGGGGVVLTDGETYGPFHRTANRVVAVVTRLASAGDPLCSEARTEDFEVTSSTPESCAVDGRLCDSVEVPQGDLLTRSARVTADGTCAVRVDAPAFAGGAGVGAEIAVTLQGTDTMLEATP